MDELGFFGEDAGREFEEAAFASCVEIERRPGDWGFPVDGLPRVMDDVKGVVAGCAGIGEKGETHLAKIGEQRVQLFSSA